MKPYLTLLFLLALLPSVLFPQTALPATGQDTRDDLVHFGDLIDIDIVGGFDFDWRGGLTPEGFLDGSDFAEPVFALCRSESEIAAEIEKFLGRTLKDPKVVVRIIDRSNRAVARLDGAIRTPTRFQIKRAVRLRELLIIAGGLLDGASGEISIFRPQKVSCAVTSSPTDNASQTLNIKIADLLSGKEAANPLIVSGDLITVSRALPIYVIGAVVSPRPIFSRDQITLSRLIATAGGLSKEADAGRVFIFRREGLEVRSIEADLEKIKNGDSNDEVLLPFDIIEVAAKGGSKRKYPPVTVEDPSNKRSAQNMPLRVID